MFHANEAGVDPPVKHVLKESFHEGPRWAAGEYCYHSSASKCGMEEKTDTGFILVCVCGLPIFYYVEDLCEMLRSVLFCVVYNKYAYS